MRIAILWLSPLNLHGDEAQYWAWAQNMNWGYFSKPPGIAAVIWASTALFGDAEWAVRIGSPILHSVTAFVLYLTGRRFLSPATGFWAAVIYLVMPALWLSSSIISTDVPLLLCWSTALYCWLAARQQNKSYWTLGLGGAIGLGLLSKYAMLFFLPSLALACLFDAPTRKSLLSLKGAGGAILAGFIIWPNILWNKHNGYATFHHTVANANVQKEIPFHPIELMTFLVDQLGVFGPISFILLIIALIWALRLGRNNVRFWLALFTLTPLVIISFEALISRANANWAVTAYIGAALLLASMCTDMWARYRRPLVASLAVNTFIGLCLIIFTLSPALVNKIGAANALKRLRGWPETAQILAQRFQSGHQDRAFIGFAFDKRIQFYDLAYYGLGQTAPLYMWMDKSYPENQAELTAPLPAGEGPYLLVNYYESYAEKFRDDFERLEPLPPLDIDLGGGKHRRLKLWAGYNYRPTTRH